MSCFNFIPQQLSKVLNSSHSNIKTTILHFRQVELYDEGTALISPLEPPEIVASRALITVKKLTTIQSGFNHPRVALRQSR